MDTNFIPKQVKKKFYFNPKFDWADLYADDIGTIDREIIVEGVYRFWRDVNQDDIVVDIGSSVGPFTCSIIQNKPKKIYCVEPSSRLLKSLQKNFSMVRFEYLLECDISPLTCINYGIIDSIGDKVSTNVFGQQKECLGITFKELVENYKISNINFLKIDCEGGEYSIFKEENMNFLINNVEFIAAEIHLNYEGCREKFKNLRDNYLIHFDDYKVMSCTRQNISWGNSIDIKEFIFDDNFIDNYTCEFMIYIYNHKTYNKNI